MSPVEPVGELRELREVAFSHRHVALRAMLPLCADELIDETAFAEDERLPYWADLWPSSRALARHVIDHPPPNEVDADGDRASPVSTRRLRIIELGCGAVALPSLALAKQGFDVLATDYEADALDSVVINADASDVPSDALGSVRTMLLDWRELPADFGVFDLVLAADVMYEQRNALALAQIVPRLVAPRGTMLLADPGRRYLPEFQLRVRQLGWIDREVATINEAQGAAPQALSRVRIIQVTRANAT